MSVPIYIWPLHDLGGQGQTFLLQQDELTILATLCSNKDWSVISDKPIYCDYNEKVILKNQQQFAVPFETRCTGQLCTHNLWQISLSYIQSLFSFTLIQFHRPNPWIPWRVKLHVHQAGVVAQKNSFQDTNWLKICYKFSDNITKTSMNNFQLTLFLHYPCWLHKIQLKEMPKIW